MSDTSQTQTHWKRLTDINYIGAYSLDPGEERTVEIVSVGKEEVTGADGKKQMCTVAKLKGEKPFILNRTNCKTLTKVYGTPYIENWTGKKVIIYADKVKAFGDTVEALRIRPTIPILPVLNSKSVKWSGAIAALRAGTTTIEAIKEKYSLTPGDEKELKSQANAPA